MSGLVADSRSTVWSRLRS